MWQWWAPDLWRRFTIALHRLLAKHLGVPANRLSEVATVQYVKVAEYQLRGVVHFHALVRLDGPRTPEGFAPAPSSLDAAGLADLEVRRGSDFEWVKSHTHRKTVATSLDQSGASPRMIADQLGHSRVSMTQDVYLDRRATNSGNLAALEAYNPDPPTADDAT